MRGVIAGMIVLVPWLAAGQEPGRTAREEYEALVSAFKAAMDGWQQQYNLVDDRDAPEAYKEARYRDWPGWAFAPQFVQFAEAHPGEPAAMHALLKVIGELGNSVGETDVLLAPHYVRALELLVRDHLDDARMKDACKSVAYRQSPAAESFLRTALEKARSREARGMACLVLARYLATRAETAEKPWFDRKDLDPFSRFIVSRTDPTYFRYVRESRPKEAYAEALRLFERALKDYGDMIYWQSPDDPARRLTVNDVARPKLVELRAKLGEAAPKDEKAGAAKPASR
jgi:hypothetical protein